MRLFSACVQSIGGDCSCLVIDSIHLANWFTMSSTDTITCATSVFKVNRALSEPHNPMQLLTITKFTGVHFCSSAVFHCASDYGNLPMPCTVFIKSYHPSYSPIPFINLANTFTGKSTDTFDNECARGGRQFVGKLITGTLRQQCTHTHTKW